MPSRCTKEIDPASILGVISNDLAPLTLTLMGSEIAGLAKVATTWSASSLVTAGWLISAGNAMGPCHLQETARNGRRCRILLQHRSFLGLLLLDLRAVISERRIDRFLVEDLGELTDRCVESRPDRPRSQHRWLIHRLGF